MVGGKAGRRRRRGVEPGTKPACRLVGHAREQGRRRVLLAGVVRERRDRPGARHRRRRPQHHRPRPHRRPGPGGLQRKAADARRAAGRSATARTGAHRRSGERRHCAPGRVRGRRGTAHDHLRRQRPGVPGRVRPDPLAWALPVSPGGHVPGPGDRASHLRHREQRRVADRLRSQAAQGPRQPRGPGREPPSPLCGAHACRARHALVVEPDGGIRHDGAGPRALRQAAGRHRRRPVLRVPGAAARRRRCARLPGGGLRRGPETPWR